MPVDGALKVVPEPKSVLVPQEVPCQYHVSPAGGVPVRVIVTAPHCGELLIGSGGVIGAVQQGKVGKLITLELLLVPQEFEALTR